MLASESVPCDHWKLQSLAVLPDVVPGVSVWFLRLAAITHETGFKENLILSLAVSASSLFVVEAVSVDSNKVKFLFPVLSTLIIPQNLFGMKS